MTHRARQQTYQAVGSIVIPRSPDAEFQLGEKVKRSWGQEPLPGPVAQRDPQLLPARNLDMRSDPSVPPASWAPGSRG